MHVEIREQPFDPWRELVAYQASALDGSADYGATAAFVGTMRDFNEGDTVRAMRLEHYPGMTEKHLEGIVREAVEEHGLREVLVLHRVGRMAPGEPIVLVAVWSGHRAEAFRACRAIMEDLKSKAPFWKKEDLETDSRWVERNTAG